MNMEIAVFIDENGNTIPLNQSGTTRVYSKEEGKWQVFKEINFQLDESMEATVIRENIKNMAEALGECRIFVARDIKGISYTILDGMGFNIVKANGAPENFLDNIVINLENMNEESKITAIPAPVRNGKEGNYFIDLKTEIQSSENFSSKQILLPFIRNTAFCELEIICGHIPPWFEAEFKRLDLKSEIEKINEGTVRVKVCPSTSSSN